MVVFCSKKLLALLSAELVFFCLFVCIVFIRLQQKTNLNLIKKVCENKDFCDPPSEDIKTLDSFVNIQNHLQQREVSILKVFSVYDIHISWYRK